MEGASWKSVGRQAGGSASGASRRSMRRRNWKVDRRRESRVDWKVWLKIDRRRKLESSRKVGQRVGKRRKSQVDAKAEPEG